MLQSVQETCAQNPNVLRWMAPPNDPCGYEVQCEAPQGRNESFTQLKDPDPAIRAEFKKRLGCGFASKNLRVVLAPTVVHMSGRVLPASDFTEVIDLGCGVILKRPTEPCDGTEVLRGEGFAMGAAGCSLIALTFRDAHGNPHCLAAHAGRLSLYDENLILTGVQSRPHFSIVSELVAWGIRLGGDPREMILRSFFSIPWQSHRFSSDDLVWGERNFLVISYLESRFGAGIVQYDATWDEHLCMVKLIEAEAYANKIGTVQAGLCTLEENGAHAHTRHPTLSNARNRVTLICN